MTLKHVPLVLTDTNLDIDAGFDSLHKVELLLDCRFLGERYMHMSNVIISDRLKL